MSLLILPWALGSAHFALVAFVVVYGLDWVAIAPPTVALAGQGIRLRPRTTRLRLGIHCPSDRRGLRGLSRRSFPHGVMGDYVFVFNAAAMLSLVAAFAALRIGMPTLLPGSTPPTTDRR